MPMIRVYGILEPQDALDALSLQGLGEEIKEAAASVNGLGITTDDVSVFFLTDHLTRETTLCWCGSEIVAVIGGVFNKPGRTSAILTDLTAAVASAIRERTMPIKDGVRVEAYVETPINPMLCTIIQC